MQKDREQELAQLLQGYFSKETADEILGTNPGVIETSYSSLKDEGISGFALYSIGAVAKEVLKERVEQANCLKRFAGALAKKFSDGKENEGKVASTTPDQIRLPK